MKKCIFLRMQSVLKYNLMHLFVQFFAFSQCKDHFQCLYWLPLFSLTISDFLCSILIICGSLLAVLSEGQISPWCEVVSLLKFTFITSSIGSIGTATTRTIDLCGISAFIVISNKEQQIKHPIVHLNGSRRGHCEIRRKILYYVIASIEIFIEKEILRNAGNLML